MRNRLLILCLAIVFLAPWAKGAELSAAHRTQAAKLVELVKAAGATYQAGDYEASGKNVTAALDMIDLIVKEDSAELYDAISPAFPRLLKAKAMLELEGIAIRPFSTPPRPEPKVAEKKPAPTRPVPVRKPTRPARTTPEMANNPAGMPAANPFSAGVEPISFTKTVAPILVQHCGRCHINGSRGNFTMATFRALAKGPPEGVVIFPGDVANSRLIETIETGSMPMGGGTVPADQLKTLKDWIAGGAKYDGPSPDTPLASLVTSRPTAANTPPPAVVVRKPTGKETVSFARDIAPILVKNCNGCHIDAMQVRGGLRMDNFGLLMRGGDSGAIVQSNQAAMSLLVKKIKGEEGDRMPAGGRPPLSNDQISLISTWIDEGATLDGASEDQSLDVMSSLAWVKTATEEELNARRAALASDNIKLVTGEDPRFEPQTTERFTAVGDVNEGTLKTVVESAEKAWKEINAWVSQDAVRGRITIFVLPRRYDYSEFAKMVEQRSIPSDWQSHWSFNGIDAYVAMVVTPDDKDEAIKAKLVGPLASLATAMRGGSVPRWFAEGAGRVAASKLVPRDLPAVDAWNRDLPIAWSTLKDGPQFIKNELPPEQSDLLGYGIVGVMTSRAQRRQYDQLLRSLPDATSFDVAFEQAFGLSPTNYVTRLKQSLTPSR